MTNEHRMDQQANVFGHPTGLYTLFFAEMWERFSYYGMRALLMFYMLKGFLGYNDTQAYAVYGVYTAMVYMTPFIGGMLADLFLGQRLAVVIGGLLMAAGHLLMTIESEWPFFLALALLIVGNGFFKPNISTMVGGLYGAGDRRRDDGFNIFYTGINLGAAISPLLCGYVGETYDWHYGFGLATIGMLTGLAVFVMPTRLTQLLIMAAALLSCVGMLAFHPDNLYATLINVFVALCLLVSAVAAWIALSRGGLPAWVGARPENVDKRHDWKIYVGILVSVPVFALLVSGFSPMREPSDDVPFTTKEELLEERIAFLKRINVPEATIEIVRDAGIEENPKRRAQGYKLVKDETISRVKREVGPEELKKFLADTLAMGKGEDIDTFSALGLKSSEIRSLCESAAREFDARLPEGKDGETVWAGVDSVDSLAKKLSDLRVTFTSNIAGIFLEEVSKPAGLVLTVLGLLAFGYLILETIRLDKIPRERMMAALVLIFFQLLFFAFFEQAGSSVNNFTDRNVDRVKEDSVVTQEMVGKPTKIQPTQAQLGYAYSDSGSPFTNSDLDQLRKIIKEVDGLDTIEVDWEVSESNVGMGVAQRTDELPASIFQSFNAIFILLLAVPFNWMWSSLRRINLDPSAPVKFGLGLIQLGCGFGAFWMGASQCTDVGMVSIAWLTLGILMQTTGELCLSPVGLSTMTKLSPKALASTLMGAWFLATAFSQYLAAVISQFTSVDVEVGGDLPAPADTVHVYGDVFGQIAMAAIICGVACLLLSPILQYWMHEDTMGQASEGESRPSQTEDEAASGGASA